LSLHIIFIEIASMNGALIIDKPEGMTSHDAVARVRRAASIRRVGHAGTLDPFATGVLVVCLGRSTRLVRYLVGLDKQYKARVRLGYATDTQDLTGKPITPLISSHGTSVEDVQRALREFTGPIMQVPPMYSAKKVGGERLYNAARQGREIARQAVPVVIHSLSLTDGFGPAFERREDGTLEFVIEVRCSSGTYIRALAHDLGQRLGPGGHLLALRRTRVGRFDISQAITLREMDEAGAEGRLESLLIPPSDVISHLAKMSLEGQEIESVLQGRAIATEESRIECGEGTLGPVRLLDCDGRLVAVGEFDPSNKTIKPKVVLRGGGGEEGGQNG
jgi:tRNA pseudouridine55 synthase